MDPTAIAAQPTGIVAWVSTYGNIVYFFAQVIFWAGMLLLTFYAVFQYKRWVNYQLGTGRSGQLRKAEQTGEGTVDAAGSNVSVDEFVD